MIRLSLPLIVFSVLAVGLIPPGDVSAGDPPWFDLENCSMCKPMMETPGLVDHVHWEMHDLANGMLSLATVAPEFRDAYAKAGKGMAAAKARLMAGEQLPLCGMCQSLGGLIMAGALVDEVQTGTGTALVVTSTDEALVARLHEHAQRTRDEMKKLMSGHGDHEHE